MEKHDYDNFAKHVLWHLTGLRADRLQMQSIIFGWAAMQGGAPGADVKKKLVSEHTKNWKVLFQDALAKCNLQRPEAGQTPIWPFSDD